MPLPELDTSYRVLLVDDDDMLREVTALQLERKGLEVVPASSVPAALKLITTEAFDVLITDLHMPNAADGFTVVSAMHHSHPKALTLLVSGNPDVDRAMATIALEPDEILIKPINSESLPELIREKMLSRRPMPRVNKERVAVILDRCRVTILDNWLNRAKLSTELNQVHLTDNERTGHLPKLIDDLVVRLGRDRFTFLENDGLPQRSAVDHGRLRSLQGYTPAMLVLESRILQVTLFETLQANMSYLDFSLLLPDVMRIADEVDSQLMQSVASFGEAA